MMESEYSLRRDLCSKECSYPHRILGLHDDPQQGKVVRLWRPNRDSAHIELFGHETMLEKIEAEGLFECAVPLQTTPLDYRIENGNYDPYVFTSTFSQVDCYLFERGIHYKIYDRLGAHPTEHMGVLGVKFAVWAPHVRQVHLVGDFNGWEGSLHLMRKCYDSGVWELFIPGLSVGDCYKFAITAKDGETYLKSDPYGNAFELRPKNASVISEVNHFAWTDRSWMEQRDKTPWEALPMNIYEVHLSSWMRQGDTFLNYEQLAHQLATYCKEMEFTHVELLPITEHPLDESWGYQVTGYFAPTSRFGTPRDFQYFVNHMHQEGIGVILDWVPSHFPIDDFALSAFNGQALYEESNPTRALHPHWQTLIFNYGKKEVQNFLIASAIFWLDKMHLDGLRVDAVASMLYLDFGRQEKSWQPNIFGGREHLEAIDFLKHLNQAVHERFPSALMIAEESSNFEKVSFPISEGGLGFDLKWSLGWMNDTLRFISHDPLYRKHFHRDLTFQFTYAFKERFVIPLSHDEVVHEKKSLVNKAPGDISHKRATHKLLYTYAMCCPGKKLFFMGSELGQLSEWNCLDQIAWHLLDDRDHHGIFTFVRDLNILYKRSKPLWALDFDPKGFEWVNHQEYDYSIFTFLRKSETERYLCLFNFTPVYHGRYLIEIQGMRSAHELINSDAHRYAGDGRLNQELEMCQDQHGQVVGFYAKVPPLSAILFLID